MMRFSPFCLFKLPLGIVAAVTWVLGLLLSAEAQGDTPVRVALQDFTTSQRSYWAQQEAAAFTAAVHALLSFEDSVEWVNRVEMERAIEELALSRWTTPDDAARLRIGQWLRADFIVVGAVAAATEEEPGELAIEVIEVNRGDVVASGLLELENHEGGVRFSARDMQAASKAVEELLREARQTVARDAGRPVIAPIAFLNTDASRRLDSWEQRLGEVWRNHARERGKSGY